MQQVDVLIVDDEKAQCKELAEFFDRLGITSATAENGFAALSAIQRLAPKIALVDVKMPGMSGIELVKHLRTQPVRPARVILMSGHADSVYEANTSGLDVFAVIEKPIPLKVLGNFVRRAIAASEARG